MADLKATTGPCTDRKCKLDQKLMDSVVAECMTRITRIESFAFKIVKKHLYIDNLKVNSFNI
jgi:hypothetical protein